MAIPPPAASFLAKVSLERVENVCLAVCVCEYKMSKQWHQGHHYPGHAVEDNGSSTAHSCVSLAWNHFVIFRSLSS